MSNKTFNRLYISREQLVKVLEGLKDCETIVLGVEHDFMGDEILWADNCKSSEARELVIITQKPNGE